MKGKHAVLYANKPGYRGLDRYLLPESVFILTGERETSFVSRAARMSLEEAREMASRYPESELENGFLPATVVALKDVDGC